MTYKGHVQDGRVVLDEPAALREGAGVRVEVLDAAEEEPLHPDILRFTGILPRDLDVRAEYAEGMARKHA